MTTKKICVMLCFNHSFAQNTIFFLYRRSFLFKELSIISNDFCGKFKDFSRISHYFSIFKDFQGHDVFSRTFQGPCRPWIQRILYNCEANFTVLIRNTQFILGGGGSPLHPPPTSAPVKLHILSFNRTYSKCRDQPGVL